MSRPRSTRWTSAAATASSWLAAVATAATATTIGRSLHHYHRRTFSLSLSLSLSLCNGPTRRRPKGPGERAGLPAALQGRNREKPARRRRSRRRGGSGGVGVTLLWNAPPRERYRERYTTNSIGGKRARLNVTPWMRKSLGHFTPVLRNQFVDRSHFRGLVGRWNMRFLKISSPFWMKDWGWQPQFLVEN